MSVRLPHNPVWKQNNYGDKFDDLWASYNLDLTSKLGTIKISPRMLLSYSTFDSASFGIPAAIEYFQSSFTGVPYYIHVIADTRLYHSNASQTFILDGLSPQTLTAQQSDLEIFNGYLYASSGTTTSLYKLDSAGNWTTLAGRMVNANGLHAMNYFRAQNRLYFVDYYSTNIGSIDTADTAATLGNQYTLLNLVNSADTIITWIKSTSTRIWIGTLSYSTMRSKIYSWDGSSTSVNEFYTIDADASLACVIKDDVPVVLDSKGRLLQLNGGTFVEIDKLNFVYGVPSVVSLDPTLRLIHHNGMALVDGKVAMLLNTKTLFGDVQENMPSGIWEYTKETGIHHARGTTLSKYNETITDYGQSFIYAVGALSRLPNSTDEGYIAGVSYYPISSTVRSGVFVSDYLDTYEKNGSLVTSKIFSPNLSDTWQKLSVRLRKLITSTDRLYVKYRTAETERLEIQVTWTSTTSFTTTTDILNPAFPFFPVFAVGDEVTVFSGVGAGKSAHITNIQVGATEWIVTLDETFTGATGTSIVHLQKWKKLTTLSDQTKDLFEVPVGQESTWIQFKIIFLAQYKDEICDIIISNVSNQPTT